MPYNTRRKSLSLPSLGIHLPVSHASRAAARSPPSNSSEDVAPPSKKVKRSHGSESPTPMSPPPKREPKITIKYENTPPPSPEAESDDLDQTRVKREIDLDAVNDDIVEAVIIQLQKTANRPHLVKELAAILSSTVKIVETSANPSAIISSRLSTYLKRSCWNANNPCPIAKELETVHPRRTYFYLTTCPHQPVPDPAQAQAAAEALRFAQRTIISPSLSSAASRSDEAEAERRRELSPSPEVDLSSHEFDDEEEEPLDTPELSTSFTTHSVHQSPSRNHRANSPPLEKDEKEFTQTARGMQKRKLSQDITMGTLPVQLPSIVLPGREYALPRQMDVDSDLFGLSSRLGVVTGHSVLPSSPAVKPLLPSVTISKKPMDDLTSLWSKVDEQMEWDMRSPEHIELDELDNLMDDF